MGIFFWGSNDWDCSFSGCILYTIPVFEQVISEHEQLLSWGVSTDSLVKFLEDVIQLDMTKYTAKLERNTVGYRSDLGGITEEVLTYRLTSDETELSIDFRF